MNSASLGQVVLTYIRKKNWASLKEQARNQCSSTAPALVPILSSYPDFPSQWTTRALSYNESFPPQLLLIVGFLSQQYEVN